MNLKELDLPIKTLIKIMIANIHKFPNRKFDIGANFIIDQPSKAIKIVSAIDLIVVAISFLIYIFRIKSDKVAIKATETGDRVEKFSPNCKNGIALTNNNTPAKTNTRIM